jgi:SH3-like domain-containing protein
MRVLGLACVYVAVTCVTFAAVGEPRRTLAVVSLRARPGERAAVVARLPANTVVNVLAIEGRWLRVRASRIDGRGLPPAGSGAEGRRGTVDGRVLPPAGSGAEGRRGSNDGRGLAPAGSGAEGRRGTIEGYLTRTTVSEPAARAAPAAQWSAARRVDGQANTALFVEVVAARAALRAQPRPDAAPVIELARGARLVVVDATADPAWIHARDPAGHDGWIGRPEIDDGASAVVVTGADLRGLGLAREAALPSVAARALAVRAELGLGFRTLGMSLNSNAQGGLANYVLAADAVAETLALDVVRRARRNVFVAADLRASASESSPGIDYPGPTAPAGTIAFRTLAGDLGVRVGTRARGGFDLALRAGGHYDAFLASHVRNAGMLPRERLLGATLGARIDLAPAPSRFTVSARFDALVLGARKQTAGLEDGTSSTARALWGGLTMRYALAHRISIFGGYDFARASTAWRGESIRQPGVTGTRRIDTAQLVEIGLSAAL